MIWLFRQLLTDAGTIVRSFALFDPRLDENGYLAMFDQLIDASLIPAPRQRGGKTAIKAGRSSAEIRPEVPGAECPRWAQNCEGAALTRGSVVKLL